MSSATSQARTLPATSAQTYASWFACLAEPTRVRLLHAVATAPLGATVGELTDLLGISQSTCSHHVRKLAETGFVLVAKEGTATRVTVNYACCAGLPQAADAVMGLLDERPCCPTDVAGDVSVRALRDDDWPAVRDIYAQGLATGVAAFETVVPDRAALDATWLPGQRWVAQDGDGAVVGWAAARPASPQAHAAGVAETAVYVAAGQRGRGIGSALLRCLVVAADQAGLWTLQASILAANRAAIALHHVAGYRTVGVRERFAQRDGTWHDTVLVERRRP